jgi:hypothetical protein
MSYIKYRVSNGSADIGEFDRIDVFRDGLLYTSSPRCTLFRGRNAFLLFPPMLAARCVFELPPLPCVLPYPGVINSPLSVELESVEFAPRHTLSTSGIKALEIPLAFPMPKNSAQFS